MNHRRHFILISLLATLALIAGWPELASVATMPGSIGNPVYYADTDTIDVPILRQNGVLVGTAAGNPIFSPLANQALATGATIQHSNSMTFIELVRISSNGGPVTSSATPRIEAGVDGQVIIVQGTSAANPYTIPTGSGALWNSPAILFDNLTSRVLTYTASVSAWVEGVTTTGGYGLVQDESLALPNRATLNFLGAGVSCADNVGGLRTDCTIPGGGGSANEWAPVAVSTTTNINLSAPGTVHDGVTLAVTTPRTRFLAWQQTNLAQNGIYTFEGGATPAVRATDADLGSEFVNNMAVYVQTGTLYGGDVFRLATTGTIVVNTSNLAFTRLPSAAHAELQANKNQNSGYMGLTTAGKAPWNRTWSYAAHADLTAPATIDVLSLLSSQGANVIGIQNSGAGNLLLTTANPRINGCTAANDGTRILLVGIDPVKTVTLPNGQGVLLVGATGSVIVGQPPGGTSVEFRCRGSTTTWEQVGGGGGGGGATGRDFFGLTSTSNCVRMGLDASNHICIYTSGGITRIEGYTAGALNATVTNKLGSGGNFQVLSDTDAVLFNVSNAGVVSGLTAANALMGNTTAGVLTCSSGGDQSYFAVVGRTGGAGSTDTTSAQPYPKAGAAYRLRAVSNGNIPSGQTLVVTLRKNGSNSALTCTMAAGTSTCTGSLGVGSEVAVAQDDLLVLGALCSGGATALQEVSWGVLIR
jgi:hypothetical protein